MRLSWNEIRPRAAAFAREWADAAYEKGETQSFYNDFFEIFGVRRRTVARYEERVTRLDNTSGFIDLFWPGVLLVEQKSAGRDLAVARDQAGTYFDALPERDRPRYQLLCDFQTFELLDRDEREETHFALADLPRHVEQFGFILGVQRRTFRDQDPVNIKASELIARLHDALKASGYDGHDLELFLVRIVFCLFADDTGIFEPRDIFLQFIEERTAPDGADLGPWMARLFQVLNTSAKRRSRALDEDLAHFPHVNGELFAEPLRIPDFDAAMRQALLDASQFDWTAISPAIFGALFQSVLEPADRRAQGAHYTTEKNILKVIEPLFLDNLRAEFRRLQARPGQPQSGRSAEVLRKARRTALVRSRVRLRQLSHHCLPRAARAGDRGAARDGSAHWCRATRARRAISGRRRPVLRDRDRRVSRPHRRDRAVDDGPHHEQPAEPGVWPDLRADSDREVTAHPPRRRAGDRLGRRAAAE